MSTDTPPTDNVYDPELHGDLEGPPVQRWLLATYMIFAVAVPFGIWWLAT